MNRTKWAFDGDEYISKKQLRKYMRRNNRIAAIRFIGHLAAIVAVGVALIYTQYTIWCVPLLLVQGALIAFLFAPMHEACHNSAFRTRALNELMGRVAGLLILRPFLYSKYRHMAHHTFTQHPEWDPDRVPFPSTLRDYLLHVSSYNIWHRLLTNLVSLIAGRFTEQEREFIPQNELAATVRETRLMAAIYLAVLVISLYFQSWLAVYIWLLPRVIGEPMLRAARMVEHTGMDESPDMLGNTRTTITNPVMRALYWNMPYHAEHHLYPSVPFHALPKIHEQIREHLKEVSPGLISVHVRILRAIFADSNKLNHRTVNG